MVPLLAALDIERNAKIGFTVGLLLGAGAYVYRIGELLGPVRDTRGTPVLFLVLAFVLAISAGALLTMLLTARSAVRLARAEEGPKREWGGRD